MRRYSEIRRSLFIKDHHLTFNYRDNDYANYLRYFDSEVLSFDSDVKDKKKPDGWTYPSWVDCFAGDVFSIHGRKGLKIDLSKSYSFVRSKIIPTSKFTTPYCSVCYDAQFTGVVSMSFLLYDYKMRLFRRFTFLEKEVGVGEEELVIGTLEGLEKEKIVYAQLELGARSTTPYAYSGNVTFDGVTFFDSDVHIPLGKDMSKFPKEVMSTTYVTPSMHFNFQDFIYIPSFEGVLRIKATALLRSHTGGYPSYFELFVPGIGTVTGSTTLGTFAPVTIFLKIPTRRSGFYYASTRIYATPPNLAHGKYPFGNTTFELG